MFARRIARVALVALLFSGPAMAGADVPATRFPAEHVQADFDQLYATLKRAHYDLFARRDRAEYDRLYIAMRRDFEQPMTELEVRKAFQRFVAYGNVAHAQIPLPFGAFQEFVNDGGRVIPIEIRVVDGRVFVTENNSGNAQLQPGDELLVIDGKRALDWLAQLRRYVSADHPPLAYGLMEFWLGALVWLEFGERDGVKMTVADGDGQREIQIPFRTLTEIRAARRERSAQGLDVDFNTREFRLLDDGAAYLRPGPFYNTAGQPMWDSSEFRAFIDDAFKRIVGAGSTDLIIDLRNNPGGDKSFSDLMVAWFAGRDFRFYSTFKFKISEPTRRGIQERLETYADAPDSLLADLRRMAELVQQHENGARVELDIEASSPRAGRRYEGKVYALINRHSYSNTTAVAALLQDYGFATILGEETHDLPSSYGAAEKFTLNHTGIDVHYPKSWFERPSGLVAVRGVVPDVKIVTPIVETREDVVLHKALEIVRSSN